MTEALNELSIAEAGRRLRAGTLTSVTLAEDALGRIKAQDGAIDSFITVTAESALNAAAAADAAFAKGVDAGPMQGIPYALKDIYMTAGIRSTCHSKLLENHVPTEDCVVETMLKAGGGVMVGKTATHEFAYGGPSFDLPFPPARNPWNTDHMPGGSSSGSGAAVAAGFVRMAMGSDTGGSIRGPAGYCGTVGLKPTYGLVSRRGVFPLSFTLDHTGPLTWTVEDCAITMQVIAGHDPLDPASAKVAPVDFTAGLTDGVDGMRLAVPRHFFEADRDLDPEVLAAFDAALATYEKLGATVEVVTLPDYDMFVAAGRVILSAEAYAIHEADLKTRPLDYGRYTQMRMAAGAAVTGGDLVQALRVRAKLASALNGMLAGYDAMVTMNTLTPAPAFSSFDPMVPSATAIHTIPYNLTGNPALSMPTGFHSSGLPLSLQIVGRPFEDAGVMRVGAALEGALGLTAKRPEIVVAKAA